MDDPGRGPEREDEELDGLVDELAGELDDDRATTSIAELGLPMPVVPDQRALDLLEHGKLSVVGQLYASSNNALLCLATLRSGTEDPELVATCIYKPIVGERPLIDFPTGTLGRRELAAFVASEATGWRIVPPTGRGHAPAVDQDRRQRRPGGDGG
jgi:hypothetical protein